VKPIIDKKIATHLAPSNVATKISCNVEESNPAPTWSWKFQKRVCIIGADSCDPDPSSWQPLSKEHTVEPPVSTASNISTITIPKDQKDTFYQCFATNRLGSDNFTKILLRDGKYTCLELVQFFICQNL